MFKRWKRIAHQLGRFLIYYLFSPIQRQNIIYFLQFSGKILFIFFSSAAKYYLFSPIQLQNIIYFQQFSGKILFIFSNSGQNIIHNYFTGKLRLPQPMLVAAVKRTYVCMPQWIIRRREPVLAGALGPCAGPGRGARPHRRSAQPQNCLILTLKLY